MRGDHTRWTAAPIAGQRPPELLRLGPGQGAGPRGVPHVHRGIVHLELADLPRGWSSLLRLDGGAAVEGVGAEGHPGALSGQTVKPGGIPVELRQPQDPRAVATRDGDAPRRGGSGNAGHLRSDALSSLSPDPSHGWGHHLCFFRLAAGVPGVGASEHRVDAPDSTQGGVLSRDEHGVRPQLSAASFGCEGRKSNGYEGGQRDSLLCFPSHYGSGSWRIAVFKEVLPVTLMGTMSVGTARAASLIFSSGVGRGAPLFHWTRPSSSYNSPPSPPPCGVWGLMESCDLLSSADEAVD
ncbi:hypothetical protein EYF80_021146 [Liparis tanakae]|uniref:Uncharacterized protein n=1 Tax=Liparis tanakae TaxID=230148 RepID=A0A4Z2HUN4_9TELE|nr:hypothetical protein EYF80_021146 [Liparis tanakae]